jgi:HSP20 family molecular chaperone IbpA
MDRNALVVKGSVTTSREKPGRLLSGEIQTTGFYRVFNLGDDIDGTTVDARFDLGVLTVKLFKKEEVRPREISIN